VTQAAGEDPQQYYSERLLLIPGMGIVLDPDLDAVPFRNATRVLSSDQLVTISCPWPAPKIHFDELMVVSKIVREFVTWQSAMIGRWQHGRPVGAVIRLLFFTNIDPRLVLELNSVRNHIISALTRENYALKSSVDVVVFPTLHRQVFLETSASAHLALDAFPFGGCLTVLVCTRDCHCCKTRRMFTFEVFMDAIPVVCPGYAECWSPSADTNRLSVEEPHQSCHAVTTGSSSTSSHVHESAAFPA
jgi:hypothetical protein